MNAFVLCHAGVPMLSPGRARPGPRPPMSATAKASKAASRTMRAIDSVEDTLPWRKTDLARGLRAAMALAEAYADVLYERRVAELGQLPGGLQLVLSPGDPSHFLVEDARGHIAFEVRCDTSAPTIRRTAQVYVSGYRFGENEAHRLRDAMRDAAKSK